MEEWKRKFGLTGQFDTSTMMGMSIRAGELTASGERSPRPSAAVRKGEYSGVDNPGCLCRMLAVEDEINVPMALSAFRDKGSRLWSLKKRKEKKKKLKLS